MSTETAVLRRCACTAVLCLFAVACLLAAPVAARAWSLADAFGDGLAQADSSNAEPAIDPGFVVGLPSFFDDEEAPSAEPAPEVAPDSAWPEPARPVFSEFYAELLAQEGRELPDVSDDPLWQAAFSAVGYEAAGLVVWLPQDFEVVAFDEVMVAALSGDFYVDVTQVASDFEDMGGKEALIEYLVELAADDESARLLLQGDADGYAPVVGEFGVELYGVAFTEEESVFCSFYVPTLDGGLANIWFDIPLNDEDAGYFGELVEFIAPAAVYVEPGSDPVDVAAVSAGGLPAAAEVVTSDGVTFSIPGMSYDEEVEGWLSYEDAVAYVTTYADYLQGYGSVSEDDLEACAAELIEQDGFYVSGAYLDNEGTGVYVYVGLSYDGYMEVYGFVPMEDGSVTLVAGLCDAYDAASTDLMAAVFQSIAYADGVPEALISGEGLIEEGSSDAFDARLDPSYIAENAKLV